MSKHRKHNLIFAICLMVYAVAFLIATAFGLDFLWGYMDAYERSRPNHAVDSYMDSLTAEYICDRAAEVFTKVDPLLQTEAECRQVMTDALSGKLTCVKNLGESTEDKTVYLVRCGSRIIGRFTIAPTEEIDHGYFRWSVISDSFDLSYLLTPGKTVTVPDYFTVNCNGVTLGDAHVAERDIQFSVLTHFYEDYRLPTLVTYQTGTTLGSVSVEILDASGNAVTVSEDTDYNKLLPSCSEETLAEVTKAVNGFVQKYVDFTSCTNDDIYGNYNRLVQHIVPGTGLAQRMKDAIAGLKWVTDRHAKVAEVRIDHCVDIGGGKFLCDVTYFVDTSNITGNVRAESHIQLVITETAKGLMAETMLTI